MVVLDAPVVLAVDVPKPPNDVLGIGLIDRDSRSLAGAGAEVRDAEADEACTVATAPLSCCSCITSSPLLAAGA